MIRAEPDTTLLGALLPDSVVVRETRTLSAEFDLFPEELAVVAASVDKRRQEFAAVRRCARAAMAVLGQGPVPLLPGAWGAPQWPAGLVGSMTHCAGFAAAVLARASDLASVGVDAEPHLPLPEGTLETIALPEELALVRRLRREQPSVRWDRLLFCAKETVYKAWFPLTGAWLDFEEARIELRADGTFSARLLVPGPVVGGERIGGFDGRWRLGEDLLAAAIAVPHPGRTASE